MSSLILFYCTENVPTKTRKHFYCVSIKTKPQLPKMAFLKYYYCSKDKLFKSLFKFHFR